VKTADHPEPGGSGFVQIKKISWLERQRLYFWNRNLADRLAAWNLELWSPERILETLGLAETDLDLIKDLSGRTQGWHPFKIDPRSGFEAGRLAALGLIRLGRWRRLVSLTEAGRVLLLFTTIDPKIKKARPEAKAGKDETDEPLP